LLGILTNKIVTHEFEQKGSNNFFMKELNNPNMDLEKIQKIYNRSIVELDKYNLIYDDLVENISINLMKSLNDWDLSRDEGE